MHVSVCACVCVSDDLFISLSCVFCLTLWHFGLIFVYFSFSSPLSLSLSFSLTPSLCLTYVIHELVWFIAIFMIEWHGNCCVVLCSLYVKMSMKIWLAIHSFSLSPVFFCLFFSAVLCISLYRLHIVFCSFLNKHWKECC